MDQEQDQDRPSRRKIRYAPKAPPPSRRPKSPTPRPEPKTEDAEAQAERLMRQFNETKARQKPRVEKKSSGQVAFGLGDTSSPSIKTYGTRREVSSRKATALEIKDSSDDEGGIGSLALSPTIEDGTAPCSSDASAQKIKEDYIEPWDYVNTCYPTTLPWRKPFSGDPEILDKAEFGEATTNLEYDEGTINSASELGLMEECEEKKTFFFQIPKKLPLDKRPASTKGKEKAESSKPSGRADALKDSNLSKLPGGYMGKLLVYKSGAVKLKLGDTLFDVSPGLDVSCAENVAAINTKEKTCCDLGELDKRAVVTPDIDSMLKR
ncbi:DNA-directed RNA polymerase III subunit RPC4 [Melia azedarach]|uniref:DNA-directed RNA polymerase III subunit RPC4 n=1 Tax=Melia azedarach TaxID=155640 RepID=A0ACC1X615_MELAZ|nr:DNA-directed RNA polymerase III subunit RPC4 [Melia azedarach]